MARGSRPLGRRGGEGLKQQDREGPLGLANLLLQHEPDGGAEDRLRELLRKALVPVRVGKTHKSQG